MLPLQASISGADSLLEAERYSMQPPLARRQPACPPASSQPWDDLTLLQHVYNSITEDIIACEPFHACMHPLGAAREEWLRCRQSCFSPSEARPVFRPHGVALTAQPLHVSASFNMQAK
jgi:hypothetical protein